MKLVNDKKLNMKSKLGHTNKMGQVEWTWCDGKSTRISCRGPVIESHKM